MDNIKYYGLPYNNKAISPDEFRNFARLLFLSQSNSVNDVHLIIEKTPAKTREELISYIGELQKEAQLIKEASVSLEETQRQITRKLQQWIDSYGCANNEIDEYFAYYNIPLDVMQSVRIAPKNALSSPQEINNELGKFIIGQLNARKILSSAVYIHQLRAGKIKPRICSMFNDAYDHIPLLPNPNIILIGSTGTGKSYILKTIARLFGMPFLKIDCASLTSSGYTGNGFNEYFAALYKKLNGDKAAISNALIFFDEFDKLSEQGFSRNEGSVGGVEMQQEFLNLIEDKEYLISQRKSQEENILLNLSNCMFVFGGSFFGIDKHIENRLGCRKSVGFKTEVTYYGADGFDLLDQIVPHDLVSFGILPELVGRVNHIVTLHPHTKETIIEILKYAPDSMLQAYRNFFRLHYDNLVIEEEVYSLLADRILETGTGARAINGILNELLKDLIYNSPNLEKENLVVNKDYFEKVFNYS